MGKIKTITGKYTKIYLKDCRGLKKGCNHQFFTQQPNKQYCSAWCRHESVLESNRTSRRKNYQKNKKKENLKKTGTIKERKLNIPITHLGSSIGFIYKYELITYLGFNIKAVHMTRNKYNIYFYNEWTRLQIEKNETFHTGKGKGKQKDPTTGSSPSHQYVTADDLYNISTAYLKENNLKCPECGNRQNLVERALLVCSNPKCGLVIGAPVLHPGFTLYDLTPIRKIAPTVQDVKKTNTSKEAHELAFSHYWVQVGILDPELYPENPLPEDINEDWEIAWKYYKKKVIE